MGLRPHLRGLPFLWKDFLRRIFSTAGLPVGSRFVRRIFVRGILNVEINVQKVFNVEFFSTAGLPVGSRFLYVEFLYVEIFSSEILRGTWTVINTIV